VAAERAALVWQMIRWARLALILLVSGSAGLSAQVFRAGVDTVLLSITVSDAHNHPVAGLSQSAFHIFEDGVPQTIGFFATERQPIALSLLIDSSSSMEDKLPVAMAAASGFVRQLAPADVAQIIDFNSDTQIKQTFTNRPDALERAIHAIRAGGSTSLYTAIYIALSELERHKSETAESIRRQAIIVLSDGEDTTSIKTYDDVADMAKRADVAIYAIGLRERSAASSHAFSEADFALRTLSQVTGGRVSFVDDIRQLPSIYEQIANELANQYVIGYNAKNTARDGGWRQIAVHVDAPDTAVRTRAGYFAPKDH
jgi:Ca-activated chloride channel family protein